MGISLTPELEHFARQQAQQRGYRDVEQYVRELVQTDKKRQAVETVADRRSLIEAMRRFRQGRNLRDDLCVRDLINEGRRI